MGSLGWSRRDADVPVNTSQQSGLLSSIQSLNPFGNRSYVQLPVTEGAGAPLPASNRRDEEEGWLACKCQHPSFVSRPALDQSRTRPSHPTPALAAGALGAPMCSFGGRRCFSIPCLTLAHGHSRAATWQDVRLTRDLDRVL